jgi:hypothetical protein
MLWQKSRVIAFAQWSRAAEGRSAEEMALHVLPVVIAGLSRIAGPIA